MGRIRRFFRWANVIIVLITFLAYLSPYVSPGAFWPVAVLGLLYPILLIFNFLLLLFWLIQRKRYVFLSLGCILLGWSHFTAFVGLHFSSPPQSNPEDQIRVLSYNILNFYNQRKSERDSGIRWSEAHLLDFYAQYQPDIWCIQEFTRSAKYAREYPKIITQKTPLKYSYLKPEKGLAIFSRYPLSKIEMHYFSKHNSTNGYLIADIDKDGQAIRVFNIHLQSNDVSRLAKRVARNGQLQEKETWLQVKGILGRYRRTAAMRAAQAQEIRGRLEKSPHPIILCGDFNDVPLSHTYHRLRKGLIDGFQKRGRGLGTTFHKSIPILRIDYILSSPELEPLEYQVIPIDRSDHYPVLSVLSTAADQ